jgi:CelD/BcsL family acetyltransferase involved in cellulose biosynthesis
MDVQVVEDERTFSELDKPWRELWARCRDATPFLSPAWLVPWWTCFAPGRLATLAVWNGAELSALLPLYVEAAEEGPPGEAGPRLLPAGIGISDVCGVLVDPARAEAVLPLVAGHLARTALPVLWTDLPAGASAWDVPVPSGWRVETGPGTPCPVLDLRGTTLRDDGLPDAVPAGRRRKVRMAGHRAGQRGGVVVRRLEELGAAAFLDVLEDLHTRRWRQRGEPGVLQDDRVRRFHRLALPRLLDDGLADAEILEIEERPAAAYYGLQDRRTSYAYLGGLDPERERESPGTLAMARAITRAAARGASSFNLLRGREEYKYQWGARDVPLSWRRLLPPA